jgi:CheY-like chemotaxis protein
VRTVLVVDDEWAVADVLEALLSDEGFRVVTASNGAQALQRAAEARPDLMIVDFMMPVLDGAGLLRALAETPDLAAIPVILMSSLPEATVAERCTGYAAFLRKPFRIAEVLAAVAAVEGPA